MVGLSFILPFLVFYLRDLGVTGEAETRKWAGWLAAAPALTQMVFAPIWGIVGDRFGRKPMVLRAMFGISAMTLLMAFARTPGQLLVIRLVEGALSGTIAANMALVAAITPRERTGYAMGVLQASSQAGHMIGPLIGGLIADNFGYRPSFLAGSAIVLLAGLMIQFFTHETHRRDIVEKTRTRSFSLSFVTVGFIVCLLTMFQISVARNLAMPLFPLFIKALHGSKNVATITGGILTAGAIVAVGATSILGRLSDSWGHKRMLITCALSMSAVTLLHAAAGSIWHLAVFRCLLGFATAGLRPSVMALLRHSVPSRDIGKTLGITESFRCLGQVLGPVSGGYIAAQFSGTAGFRAAFLAAGSAMAIVPMMAAWLLRRPRTTPKSDSHS